MRLPMGHWSSVVFGQPLRPAGVSNDMVSLAGFAFKMTWRPLELPMTGNEASHVVPANITICD